MSRILKTGETVAGGDKVAVYQMQTETRPSAKPQGITVERGIKSELEVLSEETQKILDEARKKAEEAAAKVLEEAYSKRDNLVNTAYEEADRIKISAREEGYQKGLERASSDIHAELDRLRQSVEEIRMQLSRFERETEEKIAELALFIAEKILTKQMEEDNSVIAAIVEKAVLSERDKNEIIIHITDQSTKLIDQLEERLEPLRDKVSGTIKMKTEDEPPGYVRIETEEGIIDASVYTQLENLREQLAQLAGKE